VVDAVTDDVTLSADTELTKVEDDEEPHPPLLGL